jgi:ABC-type uncharacterized transport system involved in gliding motility auxiliary subunit
MSRPSRTALRTVLTAGAVALLVGLAGRAEVRVDWTSNARYTLSLGTRELLAALPADVSLLAFVRRAGNDGARARAADLLAAYARESDRLEWRLVDPEEDPRLAREHGVTVDGTVILSAGDRREVVHRVDEESLTAALAKLARARTPRVRFLEGHGERSPGDRGPDGVSGLAEALAASGFAVDRLLLARESPDPVDADLVIVAGPRSDLDPAEAEWLARRFAAGAAVLVLVDPRPLPELERIVAQAGVALPAGVVLDPGTRIWGADASVPVVTDYARHPVTEALRPGGGVVPTFFPVARPLRVEPGATDAVRVLLRAGPEARVEGEADADGPPALAALAGPDGRLLVVGDSDFAVNGNLGLSGNRALALAAVEWLCRDADAGFHVPPRPRERPRLLSSAELTRRVTAPALAIPLLFALGGGLAIRRRRR